MKKLPLIISIFILSLNIHGQIGPNDAGALMGLPQATDLTEINNILNPQIGSVVFNLDDEEIYRYTGTTNGWQIATDDQFDDEVELRDPTIDVNYDSAAGTGTTPIFITPAPETDVQEVIQAIAPITSKAGRVFFPPSIEIDASVNVNGETIDLYQAYLDQYSLNPPGTILSAVSNGAPPRIPVYDADELYYYVTYADDTIFRNISITELGVMTYDIIGQPTDDNTIINVVFVVK
ncbi:hypothetical protein U6A24_00010 [Aquimarina gracilis]|uniref:Uncharacterized protein n=1 Tax=Aquimarina gracilis TaxID=874422 RepID=A0ABU5ZQG6_9FLAO|nr:hypothetical protein [Aquimarina gracilis]MEB3343817.1 hypothetical protein [Aquimarina gracilis]